MGILRSVICATFLAAWGVGASAQSSTVETFVQRVLASPDITSTERLVNESVDVAYLMEIALGERSSDMTPEQLRQFAAGFRGLIAGQLQVVADVGDSGQFRAQRQSTSSAGAIVVGDVQVGGRSQSVEFLVRSGASGERIADLRIGGVSASATLAESVSQIFLATDNDIDAVLLAMGE